MTDEHLRNEKEERDGGTTDQLYRRTDCWKKRSVEPVVFHRRLINGDDQALRNQGAESEVQ